MSVATTSAPLAISVMIAATSASVVEMKFLTSASSVLNKDMGLSPRFELHVAALRHHPLTRRRLQGGYVAGVLVTCDAPAICLEEDLGVVFELGKFRQRDHFEVELEPAGGDVFDRKLFRRAKEKTRGGERGVERLLNVDHLSGVSTCGAGAAE